jgi:hypothetical protein
MKSWLALVLAPSVALATQTVMYSMVTPACSSQTRVQLHLAAAVALAIVVVLAVLAFADSSVRRGEPTSHDSDVSDGKVPRRFLASMAAAVAALSALVIVGMWFALWVLTPCEP